jgi:protein-S-isoprenylcysteine O-methyltransferase Ste14
MQLPRFSPGVFLLACIFGMALLDRFVPVMTWTSWPWNLLGLIPLSGGGLLIHWALQTFLWKDTSPEPFRTARVLVDHGPYRLSRNPMYLGAALILLGFAIVFGSITALLVVPVYVVSMHFRVIRPEEVALAAQFGGAYSDYVARVRRWW